MNGGVYRKPNQCPNCGHLQDERLDARSKPVTKTSVVGNEISEVVEAKVSTPIVEVPVEPSPIAATSSERIEPVISNQSELETKDQTKVPEETQAYLEEVKPVEEPIPAEPIEEPKPIKVSSENKNDTLEVEDSPIAQPKPKSTPLAKRINSRSARSVMDNIRAELRAIESKKTSSKKAVTTKDSIESHSTKPAKKTAAKTTRANKIDAETEQNNVSRLSQHREKSQAPATPEFQPSVMLTTESSHNLDIRKHLDVLSADILFSIESYANKNRQNVLKAARKKVLSDLRRDASSLGANAVVDVKISYNEILSGDTPKMLFMATGTAVVIQEKYLKKKSQPEMSNA